MSKRKIAFIINPISGTGNKTKVVEKIKAAVWFDACDTEIYFTKCSGDARRQAKEYAAQDFDVVVAVGGDGTVNEVGSALAETASALAIIPAGSGNGLARDLHIPFNISDTLDLIEKGEILKIDVGYFNGQPYFCTAGVGYDALVGKVFADSGKRGFVSYIIATIKAYIKLKPTNYRLTLDGEIIEREAVDVTFANAGQFGNDAYISPIADLRDGLIDVVVIRRFPWYKAAFVALRLFRKTMHKSRYVNIYKCKNAILERSSADIAHFDGEPFIDGERIEISLKHLALKILTKRK
ncbi:MAG: diacylglycerol kinase family lipid kinase [Prevotellaceae bacterium]|jgi:YegS/Rv2252/BmrU family lipid kinase|nr:diacylglycerol kinase family lipid kinase [Prevotellaceae bacterium]